MQAIFSPQETENLRKFQESPYAHPYTCCDHQTMVVTPFGLVCPKCYRLQTEVMDLILAGAFRT